MDKKKIIFIFGIIGVYLSIILYNDINELSNAIQTFKIEFLPVILGIIFSSLIIKSIRQKIFLY